MEYPSLRGEHVLLANLRKADNQASWAENIALADSDPDGALSIRAYASEID